MQHPNTKRFLQVMDTIDFKKWNRYHPKEDFGQAVKRMAIENGSIENDVYPSDHAITIALKLARKYPRKK